MHSVRCGEPGTPCVQIRYIVSAFATRAIIGVEYRHIWHRNRGIVSLHLARTVARRSGESNLVSCVYISLVRFRSQRIEVETLAETTKRVR
jgi:hypothetical protein